MICFAHRHNNQIDNTHKKKSLVAKAINYKSALRETKPKVERTCREDPGLLPAAFSQRQETAANFVTYNTFGFDAHLERQGRNEFANLASQIAYNGTNIAFVFL